MHRINVGIYSFPAECLAFKGRVL